MNAQRWLRLYPASWRERYGAELTDLLADCAAQGRLSRQDRLDLVLGALRERGRAALGTGREAARAGVLWVLACWALFVVAGGAVAKFSEHWQAQAPIPHARLAAVAFDVLRGAATLGGFGVLAGAAVATPALAAHVRGGGRAALLRSVRPAAWSATLTAVATVGLVCWAKHLSQVDRNGADPAYTAGFLCWVASVVACLVASTVAGIRVARRLTFTARALRGLAGCSVVVAAAMVTAGAATATWWVASARGVPAVLCGSTVGMLLACVGAVIGARQAWRGTAQPLVNLTV